MEERSHAPASDHRRRFGNTGRTLSAIVASSKADDSGKSQHSGVKDFCAAWPAHDVGKIMSYFADNCAYRPLETMETAKGREAVEKEIKRFVNNVERFEILETWARGPMVINQRIDHFTRFQIKAWHGTGVFFLRDGKIVEWFDYTTVTDPA